MRLLLRQILNEVASSSGKKIDHYQIKDNLQMVGPEYELLDKMDGLIQAGYMERMQDTYVLTEKGKEVLELYKMKEDE